MTNDTMIAIEFINMGFNLLILVASFVGIVFALKMIKNIKDVDSKTIDANKISMEDNNVKSISNDIELFIESNKNLISDIFESIAKEFLSTHDIHDKKTFTVSSMNNLTLKASRKIYKSLTEELENDSEILKEFENAEDIVESAYFNMIIKREFTDYFKSVKRSMMVVDNSSTSTLSNKSDTSKLKVNTNSDTVRDQNGNVHLTNIFENNNFYD